MFLSSWPWSNGWWWTPVLSTTIMKHVCLLSCLNLCDDNMFSVPAHLVEKNGLHQVSLRVPKMLGFKDHLLKGVAASNNVFSTFKCVHTSNRTLTLTVLGTGALIWAIFWIVRPQGSLRPCVRRISNFNGCGSKYMLRIEDEFALETLRCSFPEVWHGYKK